MYETYIKRETPIQALQWDGENVNDIKSFIQNFVGEDYTLCFEQKVKKKVDGSEYINLIGFVYKGYHIIRQGDYIIYNPNTQDIYPCDKDLFESLYYKYEPEPEPEPPVDDTTGEAETDTSDSEEEKEIENESTQEDSNG